jgi:hypothetical protein
MSYFETLPRETWYELFGKGIGRVFEDGITYSAFLTTFINFIAENYPPLLLYLYSKGALSILASNKFY